MNTKQNGEDSLWLLVGHLLRDLSLGRWREALVWLKSLGRYLAAKAGDE